MTQAKQMIEQGNAQESPLAKLVHAGAAMPLRQRRTVFSHQEPKMSVGGAAHAERIQQHQLTRRVGQMVIAAQYLRHAHGGIIHCVAKKERRRAVFAANDEIADVVGRKTLRSVNSVCEFNDLIDGHGKAQRRL